MAFKRPAQKKRYNKAYYLAYAKEIKARRRARYRSKVLGSPLPAAPLDPHLAPAPLTD